MINQNIFNLLIDTVTIRSKSFSNLSMAYSRDYKITLIEQYEDK